MARPDETRQRLVDQLAQSRQQLAGRSLIVRDQLNVQRQLTETFHRYSWGWISLAAILGWILSRLPARKKKIYIHAGDNRAVAKRSGGLDLGLKIWGGLWSVARPLLTAYLTRKFRLKAQSSASKE